MSLRTEVLLWAQRICARTGAPAHQLLELPPTATVEQAQEAFHKIARTAHPDLHRTTLNAEELEMVTTAYARVAGAYQEFRGQRMQTTRIRPIKDELPLEIPGRTLTGGMPRTPTPSSQIPRLPGAPGGRSPTPSTQIPRMTMPGDPITAPGAAMNSKAMIYYRKAELSLRKGELKTALLQLKMAIAADPQSPFLRSALTEVEAELAKSP